MPIFALEAPYGTSEEYLVTLQIEMNERLENLKNKINLDAQEPIMTPPITATTITVNDLCLSAFKIGMMISYFDNKYPHDSKIIEYFIIGNNAVMILYHYKLPVIRFTLRHDDDIIVEIENLSSIVIRSNASNILKMDNIHEFMSYLELFYEPWSNSLTDNK